MRLLVVEDEEDLAEGLRVGLAGVLGARRGVPVVLRGLFLGVSLSPWTGFVPRLFAELGVAIRSVSVHSPSFTSRVTSWLITASQPGRRSSPPGFKILDRRIFAQGQADIIPPVQQALLAEGINLEGHTAAIGPANFLGLQINCHNGV